jgi:PTS system nitrogen regulatory IIA component
MPNTTQFSHKDIDIILTKIPVRNKQDIFTILSKHCAENTAPSSTTIYARLNQKEKDQNSGIGNGVAIPNIRLLKLDRPLCILITLNSKIQYNSIDNQPVDIICALFSPRSESAIHLQRLSKISRILRSKDLCEKIRATMDPEIIRDMLQNSENVKQAA